MILREFFAKLGLDVDAQSFAVGQVAVEGVKLGLTKLVEGAREMVGKFVEVVKGTAQAADEIEGFSERLGVSTDALQRMGKAAALEGMGLDGLTHGLSVLIRNMAAAKGGAEDQAKAFKRLGVSVDDGRGNLRNVDEVFADLIRGFSAMPDSTEKSALGFKILGRSGGEMIEVLNRGEDALEAMRAARIMTPEQIKAGKEFVSTQRMIGAQTKALWREAVAPLLPAVTDLLKSWGKWIKENKALLSQQIGKWIGRVVWLVGALGKVLKVAIKIAKSWREIIKVLVVALGPTMLLAALTAIPAALEAISLASLKAGASAMWAGAKTAASWALAVLPLVLAGAALAALYLAYDDLVTFLEGGDSLFGRFQKQIEAWMVIRGDEPWWLRMIKQFVQAVREALDLLDLFDERTGRMRPEEVDRKAGASKAAMQASKDRQTLDAARIRVRRGMPLTTEAAAALRRQGLDEEKWRAHVLAVEQPTVVADRFGGGGAPAAAPIARGAVVSSTVTAPITINGAPGQSPEQIARAARREFEAMHATKLEEALATAQPAAE